LLKLTKKQETRKILELGAGCGAISISIALELNNSSVTASDISRKALKIAIKNAKKYQIENVNFLESDWYEELNKEKFDFILSNPPYVKKNDPSLKTLNFEPTNALVSGIDGLDSIRPIIANAKYHIKNGGTLLIEHGKDQKKEIFDIFNANNWKNITCIEDLRGFPRLTMAKYAT
jgi:release factor glutamine methyltransferase